MLQLTPELAVSHTFGIHWQIEPADWEAWFDNYTRIQLRYAGLAEDHGAGMIAIGIELLSTNSQEDLWRSLISEARQVYSGKLTYSDMYLCSTWPEHQPFPAWDALDYIGVPLFYPGSGTG